MPIWLSSLNCLFEIKIIDSMCPNQSGEGILRHTYCDTWSFIWVSICTGYLPHSSFLCSGMNSGRFKNPVSLESLHWLSRISFLHVFVGMCQYSFLSLFMKSTWQWLIVKVGSKLGAPEKDVLFVCVFLASHGIKSLKRGCIIMDYCLITLHQRETALSLPSCVHSLLRQFLFKLTT